MRTIARIATRAALTGALKKYHPAASSVTRYQRIEAPRNEEESI